MVGVDEALEKIEDFTKILDVVEVKIDKATGYTLGEDVYSSFSFPHFDQSAMDGYAIILNDKLNAYKLVGEIKAGDDATDIIMNEGEAFRIFTGAMLPSKANVVVKQEDVKRELDQILVNKNLTSGENIRKCGEQIKKGDLAVPKHTSLNPGTIGFLAMLGIEHVRVFRKPRISIIATGNELVSLGTNLKMGQIFESNTYTLIAALSSYGFESQASRVEDSYELIKLKISEAVQSSDLVLITGGISVGDYDFVGEILHDLQVEEKFYKVKQKPGKPLFFGAINNTIIFGLPGNPAAVLSSFYVYILKTLEMMTGRTSSFLTSRKVKLSSSFVKSPNLTFFLKGQVQNDQVLILHSQSSAMLNSFVNANCIIRLNEGESHYEKNDLVDVFMI